MKTLRLSQNYLFLIKKIVTDKYFCNKKNVTSMMQTIPPVIKNMKNIWNLNVKKKDKEKEKK